MDVLIATQGRPELLEQTLESLKAAAAYAPQTVQQIVLVENGGDCGAERVVRSLAGVVPIVFRRIREANKSQALNEGLVHCSDGLIFMTDDDVTVCPELFAAYRDASGPYNGGVFFGGAVCAVCEVEPANWLNAFLPFSIRGLHEANSADGKPLLLGANWAAYKADLIRAGGFDPNFGPGSRTGATGQEREMQLRLRRLGARSVWVDAARVSHFVPGSRCTAAWILRRGYRVGLQNGILDAREDLGRAQQMLHAQPIWNRIRAFGSAMLGGRQRRFRRRYERQGSAGYRKGVSLVRENRVVQVPFIPEPADCSHRLRAGSGELIIR